MLAWITKENQYTKELVNVSKVENVTLRGKYISFVRIHLNTGETIVPSTLSWVNGHPVYKNMVESLK